MSLDKEGWKLTIAEIAAVLSLAGREQFVGLTQLETPPLQQEDILNACCSLVRDRLMTQVNGTYRLSRELAEVMGPVCFATDVLILTPGPGRRDCRIYYVAQGITQMQQDLQGLVLTAYERQELAPLLWELLELTEADEAASEKPVPLSRNTPVQWLQKESGFLLERLDAQTGRSVGWLRGRREDAGELWLEWTWGRDVCLAAMDPDALARALETMLKGEIP